MKLKSLVMSAVLGIASFGFAQGKYVPGHYTKSGKYVPGHYTKGRSSSHTSSKFPGLPGSKSSTVASTGVIIHSPSDKRFQSGDRLVSLKDSKGKTTSIKSQSDYDRFVREHSAGEAVTVRISRDKKYHTFKVKDFVTTFHL